MTGSTSQETSLANAVTWVIVGVAVLLTVLTSASTGPWSWRGLFALAAVLLAGFALGRTRRAALSHRPTKAGWWWCNAAAVAGLCAMAVAGQWAALGLAMGGIALGSPRPAWTVGALALVTAGMVVVFVTTQDASVFTSAAVVVTSALVALVLHVLARLTLLTDDLRRSQAEVARLEVEQERARIARDLHDIIGRTMTAAFLRNQTALALVQLAPNKAVDQIQATHDALAQGQARLREITSGPVVAGLGQELDSTGGLCDQLGISLELHADDVEDQRAARLAARVVREAVTNMLKHSRPRHCTLDVHSDGHAIHVTIDNDGCPTAPPRTGGTGLQDLHQRVEQTGGLLETHQQGDHFILSCRIPTPEQS